MAFSFLKIIFPSSQSNFMTFETPGVGGGGGTLYNGLYGEAPPERGTFFRLQVYK